MAWRLIAAARSRGGELLDLVTSDPLGGVFDRCCGAGRVGVGLRLMLLLNWNGSGGGDAGGGGGRPMATSGGGESVMSEWTDSCPRDGCIGVLWSVFLCT